MIPAIIAITAALAHIIRADNAAHAAECAKRNAVRYAWLNR